MALSESDVRDLILARRKGHAEFRKVLERIWASPEGQNPPFPRDLGRPVIEPDVQEFLARPDADERIREWLPDSQNR